MVATYKYAALKVNFIVEDILLYTKPELTYVSYSLKGMKDMCDYLLVLICSGDTWVCFGIFINSSSIEGPSDPSKTHNHLVLQWLDLAFVYSSTSYRH